MAVLPRILNLFRRSQMDREIADELQAHIDLRIEANLAAGMSPEEAKRVAYLRFGNRTATKERVAEADAHLGLDIVYRDIRYALRQLRHSPGFALTAILTLALGIGANVVVFGVLNALILHPLNFPGAGRLYEIEHKEYQYLTQSYPDYLDFRSRNTAFTDLAAYKLESVGFSTGGPAQSCWMYAASTNYFDTLGVQPALGRFFHSSDEHGPNSVPYIVLSDRFWRARFNADPRIIGATVELNKHPLTIIGVAPASFSGTELFFWPDFWMPYIDGPQIQGSGSLTNRSTHNLFVIGMLKPGVTPQQATDNLNAVARELKREHPTEDDGLSARLTKPGLMGDVVGGPARPFLAAIMALALLVLTAACVNLAGIFAARSADRTRELAIRLSIGSTRGRILRQLLTEAVLISLAGGALGTLIAMALLSLLSRWQPFAEIPIHVTVSPDAGVYLLALVLAFLSGVVPGLIPARQIWRTDPMQAMKSNSAAPGALRRVTLRDLLLGVQIALCALLVTASLVALRGLQHSLHAPIGLDPHNAVLAEANLQMAGYSDQSAFPVERKIIDEAAQIPGVTAAGAINDAPLSGGASSAAVFREGTGDFRSSNEVTDAAEFTISPGYLRAAGTRLLTGRDFTWNDLPNTPNVALVNETLARKLFGNAPAVGRHFLLGDKTLYEIVGVVEDGKYQSLTETQEPAMFFALGQDNEADMTLVVRSPRTTAEVASALNGVLASIDSSMPFTIQSWTEGLSLVLFPARIATLALGVMGLLAAMLAVTGVFGMSAYTVSKRLRELGIRSALGARRVQIMRSALKRPLLVLLSGSVAGLVLGVLASQLLAALVYEATPRDPLVLAGALAAMVLVGLVATWIPARRALHVNPAQLLREE